LACRRVSADEAVLDELALDRAHRARHARIARGKEAHQRRLQDGGIEGRVIVGLGERRRESA
jgi:hypothetical protein